MSTRWDRLESLKEQFKGSMNDLDSLEKIENLRVRFFGKKGLVSELMSSLSSLDMEQKKHWGSLLHSFKTEAEDFIQKTHGDLKKELNRQLLHAQKIDITLSAPNTYYTGLHPISKTVKRVYDIFSSMGYKTVFGPEIETQYYNFDALNIPESHPARDLADTFFLYESDSILRTQTSGVEIREMEKSTPPIAIVSPGLCFRKDEIDATHLAFFHQLEGLVVDRHVTFSDLKGTLSIFAKEFFGSHTEIRFRPDFFPFVEPGAEVAFSCPVCEKKANHCPTCKGSGYIEVAGCGLTHPQVLKNVGLDPEKYSGFAFGFGIERLAMIYYGINDIRLLYENQPDFLQRFQQPIF